MKTIDGLISKMDEIVDTCQNQQLRSGYFAILYRRVTIAIRDGILQKAFEDNARMERLDVIFAKRYIDSFGAHYAGEPVTHCWSKAFEATVVSKHLVFQHLLLGINAHINLDLGIAAAQTMQGENLDEIKTDFYKINHILASLVDEIKSHILKISPVFGLATRLAKGKDEMLMNFSIEIAREGAWCLAQDHAKSTDLPAFVHARDIKIAAIAHRLTHTGNWVSFVLRIVRLGEFRSVSGNMKILAGVVKEVPHI